jgi:carbonic anhydrase
LITAAAGALQVLLGLSRVARAALAISPVVVHAMLAGIGITIALQQAHIFLGGKSKRTAWHNVILGALVIVMLVAWRWVPPRLRYIPGPLVAIVAVMAVSVVFPFHVRRIELDESPLNALRLPDIPDGNWGAIAIGVITVALIASVESLLSAVSVDRMRSGPRTHFDRELIGQGAANIVSGTIGGLPVSGVIVRSSTNVNAGARSRASAYCTASGSCCSRLHSRSWSRRSRPRRLPAC